MWRASHRCRCPALFEQGTCAAPGRPFQLQHAQLGQSALAAGETARLASGRQHTVTGHDGGKRVGPQCLAHGPCQAQATQFLGQIAIGTGLAWGNCPRQHIDLARKVRHAAPVQGNVQQLGQSACGRSFVVVAQIPQHGGRHGRGPHSFITGVLCMRMLPCQQLLHTGDRLPCMVWQLPGSMHLPPQVLRWCINVCQALGQLAQHACLRCLDTGLGQLHGQHGLGIPGQGTNAYAGHKQGMAMAARWVGQISRQGRRQHGER